MQFIEVSPRNEQRSLSGFDYYPSIRQADATSLLLTQAIAIENKCIEIAPSNYSPYVSEHVCRVTQFTGKLAAARGVTNDSDLKLILTAARLHDAGKLVNVDGHPIFTDPTYVAKNSDFADYIERHPKDGVTIIRQVIPLLSADQQVGANIAMYVAGRHHLHWDGTGGYGEVVALPNSLQHLTYITQMALELVQVADAAESMFSRPYSKYYGNAAAVVVELERVAGTQLSPAIVPHACELILDGIFDHL